MHDNFKKYLGIMLMYFGREREAIMLKKNVMKFKNLGGGAI